MQEIILVLVSTSPSHIIDPFHASYHLEWSLDQSTFPQSLTVVPSDSVESAGVPKGLQSLAQRISKLTNWREEFCQTSPGEAERWLRANLDLGDFVNNFGHRCLKEFELQCERWGENLAPVVTTLQAMLSLDTESQSQVSR